MCLSVRMRERHVVDVEATDVKDLKRRVRRFIFGINNELSHLFSARPLLLVTSSDTSTVVAHSLLKGFHFATVIFLLLVRWSPGHTKIIVVNERVALKGFAKFP